jgi:glycosyltransferase involved in cell wall biosynthesis
MPAYNSAKWIGPAIESILAQTYGDLELIVSDNASTDGTYDIAARYAKVDRRVRALRNDKNIGANRNYRAVLSAARGVYFKWAASSDYCAPTFVEKCVRALEEDQSAVLACPATSLFESDLAVAARYDVVMDLSSPSASERFKKLLLTLGLNNAFNGLVRRQALLRVSKLGVYMSADIVLMSELALLGKFLSIDESLFFRRMSLETATKLKSNSEAQRHLVPNTRRPLRWQEWRYHLGLLWATRLAGVPSREWLSALAHVFRSMIWARRHLVEDAVYSLRSMVS